MHIAPISKKHPLGLAKRNCAISRARGLHRVDAYAPQWAQDMTRIVGEPHATHSWPAGWPIPGTRLAHHPALLHMYKHTLSTYDRNHHGHLSSDTTRQLLHSRPAWINPALTAKVPSARGLPKTTGSDSQKTTTTTSPSDAAWQYDIHNPAKTNKTEGRPCKS